jgi:hypothetical protein
LYGNEYIYETVDESTGEVISSGVTTNEPQAAREENVLVQIIDRLPQSDWDRIISGRDKKQSEGPLGESIMPAASVGYSEVVIKNIHSGKTNPGFTVKEYHTAKDDNFFVIDQTPIKENNDFFLLPLGLVNKYTNNAWVAQGYSFKIHNMHGQKKKESTFAGDYTNIHNPKTRTLTAMQEYKYFKPGEKIYMWHGYNKAAQFTYENPGKEMEVVFASSKVADIDNNINMEFDVDVGNFAIVWLPFLSMMPSLTFSEAELYTHVTTKVIQYPVILKSIKTFEDRVFHYMENYAFDPLTGRPVITKSTGEFHGLDLLSSKNHQGKYTSHTIPASQQYLPMGQKAMNEGMWLKSSNDLKIELIQEGSDILNTKYFLKFTSLTGNKSICSLSSQFVKGDLVNVVNAGTTPGSNYFRGYIGTIQGNKVELVDVSYVGGPWPPAKVDVQVVRSGCTNQLNSETGDLTAYGNFQVKTVSTNPAELKRREKFVNLLNNILNSGKPGSIGPGQIPAGLNLIDPDTKKCMPVNETIHIIPDKKEIRLQIGGTIAKVDKIYDSHPMVSYLNGLVNYFWREQFMDPLGTDVIPVCTKDYTEKILPITDSDVKLVQKAMNQYTNIKPFDNVNYGLSKPFKLLMVQNSVNSSYLGSDVTAIAYKTNNPFELSSLQLNYDGKVLLEAYTQTDPSNPGSCVQFGILPPKACMNNTSDISPFFKSDFTTDIGKFGQDARGYLTFTSHLPFSDCQNTHTYDGSDGYPLIRFVNKDYRNDYKCSITIKKSGGNGKFAVDDKTSILVYFTGDNDCYSIPLTCVQFCGNVYPKTTITNVVSSSVSTYDDNWPNEFGVITSGAEFGKESKKYRVYKNGSIGKWRLKSDYIYKSDITGIKAPYSSSTKEKNYNTGSYTLELFNWDNTSANDTTKWLKMSTITKYSPDGNAREEYDIYDIASAAKYGYNSTLPYLVAQNADFNSVFFESFEKEYKDNKGNILFEDRLKKDIQEGNTDTSAAHSGITSFKLAKKGKGFAFHKLMLTEQLLDEGILSNVWVKIKGLDESSSIEKQKSLKLIVQNKTKQDSTNFTKIARVGKWTLFEARINKLDKNFKKDDTLSVSVKYTSTSLGKEEIWIDDLRMQPLDAEMNCYVYDVNTMRLLTSFDDQHFGVYNQYNTEGKLVRIQIETERGIKTVQETQYNIPSIFRKTDSGIYYFKDKPELLNPKVKEGIIKKN